MDSPQIFPSLGNEEDESNPVVPLVASLNLRESQPVRLRSSSEPNIFDLAWHSRQGTEAARQIRGRDWTLREDGALIPRP
jgi:hypothetical protein